MIKSLIVPAPVRARSSSGIAGHGDDMKRVGRLAFRSIIYFEIVTTLALVVGLLAVNIVKPGRRREPRRRRPRRRAPSSRRRTPTFAGVLEHTVPQSFFEAAAKNEVLQIVFFADPVRRRAVAGAGAGRRSSCSSFCESLSEVMFKFVGIVMKFAPIGIGARDRGDGRARAGSACCATSACSCCTLYGALVVFVLFVLLPIALAVQGAAPAVLAGGEGAVADRVLDGVVGGGAAARDAGAWSELGVPRRIVVVRAADGLLVQPRRHHALPRAGLGVRRAGGGHRHADRRSSC